MALSLAIKRPAEDLLESTFHNTDSAIDINPMKLLSQVVPPRGAKRRKDDFPNFIRPSANQYEDAGDDSDDGASYTDYAKIDMLLMNKSVQHSPPQRPQPENLSFPCIWLNGSSPSRNPEEDDKVPNESAPVILPRLEINPETTVLPEPVTITTTQSVTPPPALDDLPKGTVVIEPSQPMGDENLPPNLLTPSTPMSSSSLTPDLLKSNSYISAMPPILTPQITPGNKSLNGYLPGHLVGTTEPVLDANGETMEVCPECHKVFKRKVYLQRHMEREHWSTAKVFKCQDCAYETKHQSNLSVHRRTHTGERPYHCGACGQRYTQGHLLKSHIRSRHAGNMELYNLEKKSDSTRGRKSLDIKHELLGVHHKQDKISALLQAAAANSSVGAMGGSPGQAPGSLSHLQKYGGGLLTPQYMNSLSYFSSLRPMMGSPMSNPMSSLSGGLLGSPRFFNLGGLSTPNGFPQTPSSLLHPLNPAMSLLNSPANGLSSSSASESLQKTMKALDMKPKISMLSPNHLPAMAASMSGSGLHIPIKMPDMLGMPGMMGFQPKMPIVPHQASPQDLTTKKSPAEADVPENLPVGKHLMFPGSVSEPQDLSYPRYGLVSGASPARPQEFDSATIPSPSLDSTQSPFESSYKLDTEALLKKSWPHLGMEHDTPPPSDEEELVKDGSSIDMEEISHVDKHECNGSNCPHLQKLKDLRRNVFRMLSVFTPDLSFENGISSETEDVDELLYEVIYTNIEEDSKNNEKA